MRTSRRNFAVRPGLACTLCLVLLLPAWSAAADYCQTLFCPLGLDVCIPASKAQIEPCRKVRAVETGVAAAEAAINGLESAYNDVNAQFVLVKKDMERIQGDFEKVSDTAVVFDQFLTTVDTLSAETLALSQNVVMRIEETRRLGDFYLMRERDRYMAFTTPAGCGYQCQAFRQEMIDLLDDIETTFNIALVAMVMQMPEDLRSQLVAQPRIDLGPMRRLIEAVPGTLLFALHEAFAIAGESNNSTLTMRQASALPSLDGLIPMIRAQLERLREALQEIIDSGVSFFNDGGTSLCVAISRLDPKLHQAVTMYTAIISVVGKIIYQLGDVLEAAGFNAIDRYDVGISFAAFVNGAVEARPVRSAGKWLKALATLSNTIVDTVSSRFNNCDIVMDQQVTLCVMAHNKSKSFGECRTLVAQGDRFGF